MIARLLILIARGWQLGPSRVLPPSCRYQPSCSAYAITALRRYGALKGAWTDWSMRRPSQRRRADRAKAVTPFSDPTGER